MNASHENHQPTPTDDLHDRLVDVALTELISGHTPPDLSQKITAAFEQAPMPTPALATRRRTAVWLGAAIAAMLLIGVSITLMKPGFEYPTAATPVTELAKLLHTHHDTSQPFPAPSTAPTAASQNGNKSQLTEVAKLVEEFNRLNHEQRYAESETVARRLVELAPEDPVAKEVWANAKFIRREMLDRQVASDKDTSLWAQLNSIEESKVQPSANAVSGDGKELVYDTKTWEARNVAPKQVDKVVEAQVATATSGRTTSSEGPSSTPALPPSNLADSLRRGESANTTVPSQSHSETITWFNKHDRPVTPSPTTFGLHPSIAEHIDRSSPQGAPAAVNLRSFSAQNPALLEQSDPVAMTVIAPRSLAQEESELALGISDGQNEALLPGYRWMKAPDPRQSGDQYAPIIENPFVKAIGGDAVSTFSIDVDTASYANIRQFLLQMNQLPPANAVRIEELINYFDYDYAPPASADAIKTPSAAGSAGGSSDAAPFAAHVEVAGCPWNPEHRLARIAVKGREMDRSKRPLSNLVFLIDVSGSMNEPAKLPLVIYGLEQLTKELGENDHIAIVVYAGTEGVVLPSTSGTKQDTILAALSKLQAGGSTAGGAGIQLAYQIAEDNFIKGGTNRVILCTDGDFNVGVTSTADLQKLVEQKAKDTGVFLSTLGFGRGNLNDAMMVAISDHGNGNYHYIDGRTEARRVLVEEMTGTLVTIAKDVKIQVEFNPAKVAGYRLIGYEKRMLRTEDFNDDKKDAGEIGAGHTVTALYEIVPAGKEVGTPATDPLKYQQPTAEAVGSAPKPSTPATPSSELLTLKMRYKAPDGDTSKKLEWPITDEGKSFSSASDDLKFAASVAGFGLLLRDSQYKGNLTYSAVQELAQDGLGEDKDGYRKEFLKMIGKAKELRRE